MMKGIVAFVMLGVAANVINAQETTTTPTSMVTDKEVTKMVQMKSGMEKMMNMFMSCMMKDVMTNCGCQTAADCAVLNAMEKCHFYDQRGLARSRDMDELMMETAMDITDEKLQMVSDSHCNMILPAPKHLIEMCMKDEFKWHLIYVCVSAQGHEEQYKSCMMPAMQKFLSLKKKDMA